MLMLMCGVSEYKKAIIKLLLTETKKKKKKKSPSYRFLSALSPLFN